MVSWIDGFNVGGCEKPKLFRIGSGSVEVVDIGADLSFS